MSTTFIILYILAVIAALLALAGVVMIVFGLTNKNKKTTMHGTIVAGIAVIFVITGLFYGTRKCFFAIQKQHYKKEMNCKQMCKDNNMTCDSMKMNEQPMNGDTCKMNMEKNCKMHGDKPCDPAQCTHQCEHK